MDPSKSLARTGGTAISEPAKLRERLMPTSRRKSVTAVIACYRDAPAVPHMYTRLRAVFDSIGVTGEIIFVNDASPDDAGHVLRELAERDTSVVVINHSRNFGSQSAFT